MRRSPVVVLTLTLVASVLVLVSSSASAEPYEGTKTGVLTSRPPTFTAGQQLELVANFPSDQDDRRIEFFEETSDDVFTFIGWDESNHLGNAYYDPVTVKDEGQDFFARTPDGEVTQLLALKPTPAGVIAPTGPDTGSLTQSPTTYAAGDSISMTANFPSGTFPITLYKEETDATWTEVATKTSNSSGNATFTGFAVTSTSQNVFARKANNDRTEVDRIAPTPVATLSIRRDCTGNECGTRATAYGELEPAQAGRVLRLQRKSGSSWESVGSTATTGADGKAEIRFSLSGVPQWSTRTYRLTSSASGSSPALTSNQILFMPGPTELGVNVLRVDVDKGIYPTTKGPEYTGVATLSTNGDVILDHVDLENFGVRGNSTVKFVKKPYKLKFLKKPPDPKTVFGMPRAKNWTLLASWNDRSLVREKAALDLGRRMGHIAWTPQSRYVEMFVNDQYRGSYLMTESVKIDGDRVNIDEETGMIMETDGDTVADSSLGFMSAIGKIVFAFKDPDEVKNDSTGVTPAKLDAIKDRINAFESALYDESTRAQYPDFIDVNSAIDFHLIQEFVKNGDGAFWRSHYFWWDPVAGDNKFHFGPAWDFDGSAGNACCDSASDYVNGTSGWIMRGDGVSPGDRTYRTHWFAQLIKDQAFEDAVEARWAAIKGEFAKMYLSDMGDLTRAIGIGASNDRNRWASTSRPRPSKGSHAAEVAFVKNWYADRFDWMDDHLSTQAP